MKALIVAARRNAPFTWNYKVFSNASYTRSVQTTRPNVVKLNTLAAWLVTSLPDNSSLHGKSTDSLRIFCYSGLTEKQRLLAAAKTDSQREYIEKLSYCYGESLDQQESIDWLFPVIELDESDDHYWNRVAQEMIAAGVSKIVIRDGTSPELMLNIPSLTACGE